jgi:hypothetical protein
MFAVYSLNNNNNLTANTITTRVRLPYISIYGGFSATNQQSLNN